MLQGCDEDQVDQTSRALVKYALPIYVNVEHVMKARIGKTGSPFEFCTCVAPGLDEIHQMG